MDCVQGCALRRKWGEVSAWCSLCGAEALDNFAACSGQCRDDACDRTKKRCQHNASNRGHVACGHFNGNTFHGEIEVGKCNGGVRTDGAELAAEAIHATWRELERLNISPQLALESLFIRVRRLVGPRGG